MYNCVYMYYIEKLVMASIIDQPLLTCWALNVAIMPFKDSGLCRVHFLRPKVVRAMAQQNLDLLKGFKGSPKNKTYAL